MPADPPRSSAPAREFVTDELTRLESALTGLVRRSLLPTVSDATRAAAGVTLERASYRALVRIAEHGPLRLSGLAELAGLDVSTVSRHVARLEEDGYVERRPDPDDGRAHLLSATSTGADVLARVRDARRRYLADLLRTWDDGDVAHLSDLLSRLVEALDDDRACR